MSTDSSSRLVIVDYQDIASSKDLSLHLLRAFGGRQSSTSDSPLGIIAIRNIPHFLDAKQRFLPLAHALAHLDPEYLEKNLSDPKSLYNAGWSHGREKLGDVPDLAKASYYFNPITDTPGTKEERDRYPASYPCNKWPNEEELPQLKQFKAAAKALGKIMHEVVILLAKHIDVMAAQRVKGYTKDVLYDAMRETEKAKGRLLYYYPLEEKDNGNGNATKEDNWIGWHNDSGFLTSLAGDMYIDDITGKPLPASQVDPEAGLYVTDRSGESIHVTIPQDCLAVQIGECVQILTGGVVVATPHCVRGPRADWNPKSSTKVARISHPCFIDSKPTFPLVMPDGCSREDVVQAAGKVPPLAERWVDNGMTFGDFLQKSFEKYYDWEG
mmetsp:Transcript_41499/g.74805  ORF Transcript_41499/g.74805 Transcript_41499/m.74805 type:complete len:383 (+) Transcript_41499:157-1305(+)|eukprot:CAMPEP_0201878906 /NCGR_PEP_ID=MMETSP0902-20130614/9944_1 /ASSEMBLY_ACC=CAM_ASM_000551 /TAXON_ID=420261 /ORGANISM="Thalassiosira antarctica, Strain CCMP982" /LENGTH=382 /DNA_ID=CAMNT_0048406629 /DNA_START=34 /DNA_END=1182 /DNA_ORIENTATION=+